MNEFQIIELFASMKMIFNCKSLKLNTYIDASSSVSLVLSKNIEDFIKRETERKKVACIYSNIVTVNLSVVKKISTERVEEILLHEITHYLLPNISNHNSKFWEEFDNNCKIWQKKKGEYKCH